MIKLPTIYQWRKFPSVLNKKERCFVMGIVVLIIVSALGWIIVHKLTTTIVAPDFGGSFTEGIVGNPQYINPVLSQASDSDRDVTELIFSGLTKYNSKGEIVPNLAQEYKIGDNGKTYEFTLRTDIKWHDGENFTADDVVFTITTIQNPEFRSPLRVNWSGVEIEKIDDYKVRFKLKTAYAPFLANTTTGIIAKHIWEKVTPANFSLVPENLEPIGTGLYQLTKINKNKDGFISYIRLEAFGEYASGRRPFIDKINLNFYPDEITAIKAYNRGQIDNLSLISIKNKSLVKGENRSNIEKLVLPRYFAVFFNQSKSKVLSDKVVRQALNYATNKKQIIEDVLNGEGETVDSPIPAGIWGHANDLKIYDFAQEHANNILEAAGWKDTDNDGIREKGIEELEIELVTTDMKELQQVANILQEQWSKIGVKTNVKILEIGEVQQEYVRPREYQALLFGEVLGFDPDPFSFWHSTQKKDPGLNLALYDNTKVDALLRDARQILEPELRLKKYKDFQQLVIDDAPVVFLYSSYQIYLTSKNIKGFENKNIILPSKRFTDIESWYIKTQRIKK
ncbi:MAG: ABC transporter substrate-binding protein [Candidatus Portnoybacteria bacterium]|nr:ABC transporter substrate-binding protein [Candidatus Portnoybacteria bacterium]